jgi:uncharacterized protein (TIGR02217 family)
MRRTDVVALSSGGEERNAVWARSRRKYAVGWGVKTYDQLMEVIDFWEERLGRLHGFRFKDHLDFKSSKPSLPTSSTDQLIGTGNGSNKVFQLAKAYGSGVSPYLRIIQKPVGGTVKLSLNNVPQPSGWSVDSATGIVTFTVAPANGIAVRAGFEFDVPVRFDTDNPEVDYESFQSGSIPDIPLIEIKP